MAHSPARSVSPVNAMNEEHDPFRDPPNRATGSSRATEGDNVNPNSRTEEVEESPNALNTTNTNLTVTNEKEGAVLQRTKTQKMKRHFGRFWWWYLIAGIVLAAILLPILFLVIIPKIVQNVINGQKLPIWNGYLNVLGPSSIAVGLNFTLKTPLPTVIEPVNMSFYVDDKAENPFVTFQLPEEHVSGSAFIHFENQTQNVLDHDGAVVWLNNLFDLQNFTTNVRANPTVRLGKLTSHPRLDKTITLPGLNYLKGVAIQDIEFMFGSKEENGNNMKGTIMIPNAGVLGLAFGDLSFNMMSGNLNLGSITLPNVVLNPGNNTAKFAGSLDFGVLTSNIGTLLSSQGQALKQGNIQLNTTGKSVIVNGQDIPLVEEVLSKKTLTLDIPILTLGGDLLNGLAGLASNGSTSFTSALGDVFGNTTLLGDIANHWNMSSLSQGDAKNQVKRAAAKGHMAWNLFKMSMAMKQ
ncbi:Hypothetical protein R9X50_00436700 [Acrodontium crateriforme]|uniref:Uncharacterized protein n=1 Tax=Acrodontium crateriforme TaxID=150365 RepID=A0AAQ3R506_9PEZI|nr:Hypothetical protein R9X50_00436700 [Acrodontium crateriforme]